jgi:hypothetical protein
MHVADGAPNEDTPRRHRVRGRLRGQIKIAADFDDTPDDLIDAFEDDSQL